MSNSSSALRALDVTVVAGNRQDTHENRSHIPLGDWLVRRGVISRVELFKALNHSYLRRCRIGDAIVDSGLASRERVEEEAKSHSAFIRFINGE